MIIRKEVNISESFFDLNFYSESDTFNYLELTLNDSKPRTPVLDCQLGYCLTPLPKDVRDHEYFLKKYRRSIINWVIVGHYYCHD